jgi:hypothetical protein
MALAALIVSAITAIGIFLTGLGTLKVKRDVSTENGISAGRLLERQEGHRIKMIPPGERTPHEEAYVVRLDEGGRDL